MVHGKGGLFAHLGTSSVPEILDRIREMGGYIHE